MATTYGTPVDESTITQAQFQNYLRAPAAFQAAMRQVPHNSDAYYNLQNAVRSAEQDLAMQPGMVQVGTDGQRHQFAPPVVSPKRVAESALNYLPPAMAGMANEIKTLITPPGLLTSPVRSSAEPPEAAGLPSRQRAAESFRRGMQPAASPVTMGTINGRRMAVPTAGNFVNGNFAEAIRGVSPDLATDSMYGVDASKLRNAQDAQLYLGAGMEVPDYLRPGNRSLGLASDIRSKQLEGERTFQKDLERIKNPTKSAAGTNAPKTPLEFRRDLFNGYRERLDTWRGNQQEAERLEAAMNSRIRSGSVTTGVDPKSLKFKVRLGKATEEMTVGEAQDLIASLRGPKPTAEEYAADLGVDPSWLDLTQMDPGAAPGGAPAAAGPKTSKPAKQTDTAELDRILAANLDRAIAIAEKNNPADVPYLKQRKRDAEAQRQAASLARR